MKTINVHFKGFNKQDKLLNKRNENLGYDIGNMKIRISSFRKEI